MYNIYVKNLGHEAEVNKPPVKHPGFKPSCYVYSSEFSILIDVTKDIFDQLNIEEILNLDAILLTHAHSDSIGGFAKLNDFLKKSKIVLPLYLHFENINILKTKFKDLTQFEFKPLSNNDSFKIKDVFIKSFFVYHDLLEKFPTLGYTLYIGEYSVCYASDFGFKKGWEKVYDLKALSNNTLAILDGAYWDVKGNLWNHVSVLDHLDIILTFNNKYTYFTGYGNTYPKDLDKAELILNYLLLFRKTIDPSCKVEKLGLVKDMQVFNLTKL